MTCAEFRALGERCEVLAMTRAERGAMLAHMHACPACLGWVMAGAEEALAQADESDVRRLAAKSRAIQVQAAEDRRDPEFLGPK